MSLPSFYQTKKEPEKDPVKVYFAGKMDGWRDCMKKAGGEDLIFVKHGYLSLDEDNDLIESEFDADICNNGCLPIRDTKWENIHFVGPYRIMVRISRPEYQHGAYIISYSGPHTSRKKIYDFPHNQEVVWHEKDEYNIARLENEGQLEFKHGIGALGIDEVWALNTGAIDRCDLFVAYLSEETCFGTLTEIGYAHGIGKRVVIFKNPKVSADFSIFAEQYSTQDHIWEIEDGKKFDEVFEEFLIEEEFIQPAALEHVYVMRLGDTQHYKIGRTTRDPTEREKELNGTKAPYDVNLVCQIKTNDCAKLEAFFHEKYKETRGRGEWFNLTPHQIFELVAAAKISEKEAIDCSRLPLNLLGTLRLESN